MIISMGDNGFSTSLSDQKCDFAHLHCSDYKRKGMEKMKKNETFAKFISIMIMKNLAISSK